MKKQAIEIIDDNGDTAIQIQAHVSGALAVHHQIVCTDCIGTHDPTTCRGWREAGAWVVTHIPSGRYIGYPLPSYRQAVRYKTLLAPLADWTQVRHGKIDPGLRKKVGVAWQQATAVP